MILDFLSGPVVDYIDNQENVVVLRSRRQFNAGREVTVRISVPGSRRPSPTRVVVQSCRPLETGGYALSGVVLEGQSLPSVEVPVEAADGALRRAPRLDCHICVLSKDLPGYRAVTVDYNCGGVQLEVPGEVEAGARVLVRLEFDVPSLPALECSARVAWCSKYDRKNYRVGLQFVDLDEKARDTLARFEEILKNREDTPILHRLLFGDEGQPAAEAPEEVPQATLAVMAPEPPRPVTGSDHEGVIQGYAKDVYGVTVTVQRLDGAKQSYRFFGQRGLVDHLGAGAAEHEIGDLVEKPSAGGCQRYQFIDRWRKVVLEVVAAGYNRS